MGQSQYKWIFVTQDGKSVVVEGQFDDIMELFCETELSRWDNPVAIIRGDFTTAKGD